MTKTQSDASTPSAVVSPPNDPQRNLEYSQKLARTCVESLQENGGQDIVVLDMTGVTALFDYFVIATGTSRRQLLAMADEINVKTKAELNDRRSNMDAGDTSRWIVLDYGTVVIHLFDEETRQFYSLEALWGDVPRVDFGQSIKRQ